MEVKQTWSLSCSPSEYLIVLYSPIFEPSLPWVTKYGKNKTADKEGLL